MKLQPLMLSIVMGIALYSGAVRAQSQFAPPQSQGAENCTPPNMAQAAQRAKERIQKEVENSAIYEAVKTDRMGAFECQMSIAGDLSSWVQSSTGLSFLDQMFSQMTDQITRRTCDEFKARAREAQSRISQMAGFGGGAIPTSADEAMRRAQEAALRAAQQATNQGMNEVFNDIPRPSAVQVPSYIPNNGMNDPWGAIRQSMGGQ